MYSRRVVPWHHWVDHDTPFGPMTSVPVHCITPVHVPLPEVPGSVPVPGVAVSSAKAGIAMLTKINAQTVDATQFVFFILSPVSDLIALTKYLTGGTCSLCR